MTDTTSVLYRSVVDENGDQYSIATLTSTDDQREKIVLAKPYVIPIVFLPGIMGTNLRKKKGKAGVWQPPNLDLRGAADMIAQLFVYLFKSSHERAGDLVTDTVEIDPSGPIDAGESGLPKNVLVARGWGAVMRSSYHPFMAKLQHLLNDLSRYDFQRCEADLRKWAAEAGQDAPTAWGAKEGDALTREEILHAANYQFDVWAGGYNWLQSNRDSGAAIKELIEKTILPFYNEGKGVFAHDTPDGKGGSYCYNERPAPNRPMAEKVIVVTHSMGGMVSRALTELHQCDKVLGVSHGVQPATGAPATYKRMRSGFEGPEQLFLGRNAADVVAILSQSPGGLELLPTADYNDGKPWLKVRDKGSGKELLALPENGDPYSEIYCSPAWYGLVPDGNLGLMDPEGKKVDAISGEHSKPERASPRVRLNETIERVREFHLAIEKRYKKPTYAHYGAQGKRVADKDPGGLLGTGALASKDRFAWGEVSWEGRGLDGFDAVGGAIVSDDGNGKLRTASGIKLTISNPECAGDGTVPVYSGEAPNKAGISLSFAHGHGNPGRCNDHFGYDHQASYGDEHGRSLYATMYAIIKIAQQARWHKKESA
ncbi:GPI inositol-deacylase [Burkholderia sp. AU39826]|uniref:GPI inositol-deacylase n=1 Tax=Burkholderia sp. AU39826 TaxID=2879634 RepID=UPI001CF2E9E5|nr:GPI inositol-deacylase [Burkholderia sp. AU39826]MCA7971887.1 GPI inositol-deacylase [Burkholderia sp. AU39826]